VLLLFVGDRTAAAAAVSLFYLACIQWISQDMAGGRAGEASRLSGCILHCHFKRGGL
jgi:hypothetical protein